MEFGEKKASQMTLGTLGSNGKCWVDSNGNRTIGRKQRGGIAQKEESRGREVAAQRVLSRGRKVAQREQGRERR